MRHSILILNVNPIFNKGHVQVQKLKSIYKKLRDKKINQLKIYFSMDEEIIYFIHHNFFVFFRLKLNVKCFRKATHIFYDFLFGFLPIKSFLKRVESKKKESAPFWKLWEYMSL